MDRAPQPDTTHQTPARAGKAKSRSTRAVTKAAHVPVGIASVSPGLHFPEHLRPAALLDLQRSVGNDAVERLLRAVAGGRTVQRANPTDPRLPASEAEALTRAREAKTAIDAAIAAMGTSPLPERRNAVELISQKNWVPAALTPRHDSTLSAPTIHFFPGQNNYSGSQRLDAETTHKVSPKRIWVYVRARDHVNVDNPLPQAEIEARIAAAVSEIAHTEAAHPGQPKTFDLYRARFNGLFDVPPFSTLDTAPDLSLPSRGPRTPRAHGIFERILADEAPIRTAYDANTGGIKEQIDSYAGPEGMNRINSPRLQKLREAFFSFSEPVPDAQYARFRSAIQTAATGLDGPDRKAIDDSNDWQRLINVHVTEETKRQEIRLLIAGSVAGPAPNRAAFLASWRMRARFYSGQNFEPLTAGATTQYHNGTQQFAVHAELPPGQSNTGLVLFVRASVARAAAVAGVSATAPFPPRGQQQEVRVAIAQPASVPAAGESLTIRLELLDANQTTVLDTKTLAVTARAGTAGTKPQAIAAARQDQTHFMDTSPSGLLGKMAARGGHAARVAEAIRGGSITIEPLTPRHDSQAYVGQVEGAPNPDQIGLFHGVTYDDTPGVNDTANSMTTGATVGGLNPAYGVLWVMRTFDVGNNSKIPDEGEGGVIDTAIHEAVHALDAPVHRPDASLLDGYKTEFRAFWLDGKFGPPDQATCPTPPGSCLPTAVDPSMAAPGPKSPRARAIFEHLYRLYDYIKRAYDNVGSFRDEVDRYVWPDGINLIVSIRLDRLQKLISDWNGTSFAAFQSTVRQFTGAAAPPPTVGVLTPEDRQEITNNRAWRDLVDDKVRRPGERAQIKADLGIPA